MCTMQVRLTADPMGCTGLGVADLHATEVGAETEDSSIIIKLVYNIIARHRSCIKINQTSSTYFVF